MRSAKQNQDLRSKDCISRSDMAQKRKAKKMKILRLSLFNIKKHKKESFVIIFLIMISMALLGIGIINIEKADRMFDEMFEKTGSYDYLIMFPGNSYKNEYGEIVEDDERVTETFVFGSLNDRMIKGRFEKLRTTCYDINSHRTILVKNYPKLSKITMDSIRSTIKDY